MYINAVYFEMNCLSVMDISRVMLALPVQALITWI